MLMTVAAPYVCAECRATKTNWYGPCEHAQGADIVERLPWRAVCEAVCAYKGEPPCFSPLVAGDAAKACEVCEPAAALLASERAESERLRAVILNEHRHKPDDGCRAMTDPGGPKPPGPSSPPIGCALPAGHAGPHRTMYGGSVPEPVVLRDPGPGWCAKCNVRWPCDIARPALSATKPDIEAAAQWLMDDDTSYRGRARFRATRGASHARRRPVRDEGRGVPLMDRTDLIKRLEEAREGSRELDLDIALAIDLKASGGQPRWDSVRDGVAQDGRGRFTSDALGYVSQIPRYTRSVDAALTLVPEGHAWSVQFSASTRGEAWLYPPDNIEDRQFYAAAATAPLALCAAALKAREAAR
jgi:hypothetical protein